MARFFFLFIRGTIAKQLELNEPNSVNLGIVAKSTHLSHTVPRHFKVCRAMCCFVAACILQAHPDARFPRSNFPGISQSRSNNFQPG